MARRVSRLVEGHHVPQLERGLRAHAARFADRIRLPILDRLEHREPFEVGGDLVWTGLNAVDPGAAEAFRSLCGYQRGARAAWLAVDDTRWTFDPRTAVLTPRPRTPTPIDARTTDPYNQEKD